MPTVRQLAKLAGVSPATVSLALRNKKGVKPATRRRILELAEAYQYHLPPAVCTNLPGRGGMIGFITPSFHNQFHSLILAGILTQAFTESTHIVPLELKNIDLPGICLAIETLAEQGTEGILLNSGLLDPLPADVLFELASRAIPLVCIGDTPTAYPIDRVNVDEGRAGQIAINYLHSLGHRDIAYIGNSSTDTYTHALIQCAHHDGMSLKCIITRSEDHLISALTDVYDRRTLPTAIVCHNDYWATHALHYIRYRGLQVPRDISVLGHGQFLLASFADPPLSSITLCPEDIGRRALSLLFQRIQAGKSVGKYEAKTILVEPMLALRNSCGPPRHLSITLQHHAVSARSAEAAPMRSITGRKWRHRAIAWRPEDTKEAMEGQFLAETVPAIRARLQALWLLRQGSSRAEVIRSTGVTLCTLNRWLAWYAEGGLFALTKHPRGKPASAYRRLTVAQCALLAALVNDGTLRTIAQARDWVARSFHVEYRYWGMRSLLLRLGVQTNPGLAE
ncbi:MAG: LacI family DNA-binding transcriptional regulator [Armatimonadota bacterium]